MIKKRDLPPIPEGFSSPVEGRLLFLGNLEDEIDIATDFNGEWDIDNWIGSDENSFYSLRIGSDIYEKNKVMFDDEESTGHPHAESMLEYAKDWAEAREPWERWQYKGHAKSSLWQSLNEHPNWMEGLIYRRKEVIKYIDINGTLVPEPIKSRADLISDMRYYYVDLVCKNSSEWGRNVKQSMIDLGLVHSTKEGAKLHRRALLSFAK